MSLWNQKLLGASRNPAQSGGHSREVEKTRSFSWDADCQLFEHLKCEKSSEGSCKYQTDRRTSHLTQRIIYVLFSYCLQDCRRAALVSGCCAAIWPLLKKVLEQPWCSEVSTRKSSIRINTPALKHTYLFKLSKALKLIKFFLGKVSFSLFPPLPLPTSAPIQGHWGHHHMLSWHQEASPSKTDRELLKLGSFSPVGLQWSSASFSLIREFYFLGQNGALLSVIHDREIIILF